MSNVQLCSDEKVGKCTKGDLCKFAHHLGELREPGEQFSKSHQMCNFNKWSRGEILHNKERILETISWAIWGMEQGSNPPDWILNLHWRSTIEFGFEYLKDVTDLVEKRGPKKPPCSRSPEPHTADDGEGGPKTEGPQPHERWHSRKRKKLADHIGMPLLSQLVLSSRACGERQVQAVATCLNTVLRFAQEETSSQTRGSDPHSDHRRTSKEHRRDRDHCGISKEERRGPWVVSQEERAGRCIIRAKARPKSILGSGDRPTRRRTRSNPQVRHHSQESYTSYSSSSRSYYPGPKHRASSQDSRSLSTLRQGLAHPLQ